MKSLKEKVYDWKDRLKDRHMLTIVIVLLTIIIGLGLYVYKQKQEYRQASENSYNMAFYELVNYVESIEVYLAKSLISKTPEHGAETLTYVWREANLAATYLSQIPISTEGLSNAQKFLNQVSEYSYSLSRKNINNEALTQEDLNNLRSLHSYSVELKNTLNQLSNDINSEKITWGELTQKGTIAFAQEVSNISKDSFANIEQNFHEYQGLIYDGAFSEHLTNPERKGLKGENINEEQAKNLAEEFVGKEKIKEINAIGLSENGTIPVYTFNIKTNEDNEISIAISQEGGHTVFMNCNRNVEVEILTQEEANDIGKKFLEARGLNNMKETYYLKQQGVVTINYAYVQNDVVMYPDLIKVKVALDNGEILGMESSGYLNSHEERNLEEVTVTKEQAKESLNKELNIQSEQLAVIPTEYKTEILCWEFKGNVEDINFLVYINAKTGKEEDILIIVNTPNGTLTM